MLDPQSPFCSAKGQNLLHSIHQRPNRWGHQDTVSKTCLYHCRLCQIKLTQIMTTVHSLFSSIIAHLGQSLHGEGKGEGYGGGSPIHNQPASEILKQWKQPVAELVTSSTYERLQSEHGLLAPFPLKYNINSCNSQLSFNSHNHLADFDDLRTNCPIVNI
jgi:hypothetical protein